MRALLAVFAVLTAVACSPAKPAKNLPPPSGALNVVSQKADGLGEPEVTFQNTSDQMLSIDFDGPKKVHLDVPANESRSVKLAPGTYQTTTSGDGLISITDTATFAPDYRYNISLKVILEVDMPEYAGKGFDCFEVQTGPRFMNCARLPNRCQEVRKKLSKPELTLSECTHYPEVFHLRATLEGNVKVLFFTTQAACEAFVPTYQKQFPKDTITPCAKIQ